MKTFFQTSILVLLFIPLVVAANTPEGKGGGEQCVVSHEQMATMHQHMQEMQELMTKIKAETDPAVREALMQQHLADMESGMQSMNVAATGDKAHCEDMASLPIEERMSLMEAQSDMMRKMMMQMMSHDVERMRQKKRKH